MAPSRSAPTEEMHVGSMLAALGLVFVAELGDKTQLVAMGFGARHRLGPVIAGVVAAYCATNLVSVLVGGLLGAALPTRAIGIAGGVMFLGFAAWTLRGGDEEVDEGAVAGASRSVVASVFLAMFVAELGDKTQLATATLAAQGSPVLVWVGATLGIVASGLLGVMVGRLVGKAIPEAVTRYGSAVLFAGFGLVLLVTNLRG